MNDKNCLDVCIIGAGLGGLTTGALLTKQGYTVKIYEKESTIGGRALCLDPSQLSLSQYKDLLSKFNISIPFSQPDLATIFKKKMLHGYKIDLGYHTIGGGALSNINSVLSELDDHVEILESRVGFITETGFDFPFLQTKDILKISPHLIRLLISGEKTMKRLDNVSMTKTIQKYGKGKMKLILEVFSRSITTVNNLDRISTGEMFRSQKNLYKGSKPVGYPKGGMLSIYQKLADFITSNGGEIHLNTPVTKILIKDKKANGIVIGKSKKFFDTIISNILIQNLFSIADEKHFPKNYITNIKSLKGTGSLCAYYSLSTVDSNLFGKTFHFIERNIGIDGDDAVGMIDFMVTSPNSGLAPPSHHLVQSYIICNPEEAKDKATLMKLKELLDKNLEKLIPNYRSQLNWALYPKTWHLDGVAKTIDNKKPEIKTPIKNLFIVGDCVKAPGIGVNCAVNSGRMLVDLLSR